MSCFPTFLILVIVMAVVLVLVLVLVVVVVVVAPSTLLVLAVRARAGLREAWHRQALQFDFSLFFPLIWRYDSWSGTFQAGEGWSRYAMPDCVKSVLPSSLVVVWSVESDWGAPHRRPCCPCCSQGA